MKSNDPATRGQALVIIALAAIVLVSIVGLAIDGSAKFSDRRHAQNAADTAALAAALAKVDALTAGLSDSPTTCPPTSGSPSQVCTALQLAGLDRAASNGYNNNLTSNIVQVYSPPISGAYSGNSRYIQVIVTSYVRTFFARVIGINQTVNTVQAVTFTRKGGPLFNGSSIVSLDPNPACGNGSVSIGGSGTINLTGGGLFVNSSSNCGVSQSGCNVTFNVSSGGVSSAGSSNINWNNSCPPSVSSTYNQTQFAVPEDVYMPAQPAECNSPASAPTKTGSKWYLHPGYYSAFPPNSLNNKDLVMDAGIYCVGSSISWSGSDFASLDGSSGVTIYVTSGNSFGFNINSPINLDATNSGNYAGYVVILEGSPSNIRNCTINGSGDITLNGTVFLPYCNVTVNGNSHSDSPFNAQVIGYDVTLNGNNTITFNYDPANKAQNQKQVGLMK